MKANRETIGPRLRHERERRGISLKQIAHITKIKESQFAELERGDISKWPQGIFRRAHLSAYLSAIGLPCQPILSEFLELFPEESLADHVDQPDADGALVPQNAGQATVESRRDSRIAQRLWILTFDFAAVCCLASLGAAAAGAGLWACLAVIAIGYFSLGSACFGQSIGGYVRDRMQGIEPTASGAQVANAPLRKVRLIVPQRDGARAFVRDKSRTRDVQSDVPSEMQSEVQPRRASA
jgi:transcriptional regulator with XRE-family HTH domain